MMKKIPLKATGGDHAFPERHVDERCESKTQVGD